MIILFIVIFVLVGYIISLFSEVNGLHDWLYPGSIRRLKSNKIILTFDDGPDPVKTPQILAHLQQHNKKAVFFVVGEKALQYPYIIKMIYNDGHQIGNHSWSHNWLPGKSYKQILADLKRCQDVIHSIVGESPRYARPPYGQKDYKYYKALQVLNLSCVLWSYNLRDYYKTPTRVLSRRLNLVTQGNIILAHDGDNLAPNTPDAIAIWLASSPSLDILP